MQKPLNKLSLFIIIALTATTCIEPYFPKLQGYNSLLVVDALITNDNRAYTVKLSHSVQAKDSISEKISDAEVYISDGDGTTIQLTSLGNGIYNTDSVSFRGEIGKTYILHIKTSNGKEYESDSCKMLPVPEIDSIYFSKDQKLIKNQSQAVEGISIYLDTKTSQVNKSYLRWEFEEAWKFRASNPKRYNYLNDSTIIALPGSDIKEFCWKSAKSTEILEAVQEAGDLNPLKKQSILFIAPEQSDRLTIRYSVLIKQYSVSQKEYDYWYNLKQVGETEGDIFGTQPFAVLSNIKNIKNPSEQVLGYFQVSAVEEARKFIDFGEIVPLDIPLYHSSCNRITKSPADYPTPYWAPKTTFDKVYSMWAITDGYAFVEPIYDPATGKLLALVFTSPECANCELTGKSLKPYFWTDK